MFLYFYQPFQDYISAAIPNIHFSNVLFWFASVVGVVAYAVAHWQSFRQNMLRAVTELDVEGLVYDTLQITVLTGVIFVAGATLQSVEMLGEHLMSGGPVLDAGFGRRLASIVMLVILIVLFYLLHQLIRAFRARLAAPASGRVDRERSEIGGTGGRQGSGSRGGRRTSRVHRSRRCGSPQPRWPRKCGATSPASRRSIRAPRRSPRARRLRGRRRPRTSDRLLHRLIQVPQDVVEALDADREPNHVRRHTGCNLIVLGELAVGRRSRMDDEGLRVADVREVTHEL